MTNPRVPATEADREAVARLNKPFDVIVDAFFDVYGAVCRLEGDNPSDFTRAANIRFQEATAELQTVLASHRLAHQPSVDREDRFRTALWNACRSRGMSQDGAIRLIELTFADPALASSAPAKENTAWPTNVQTNLGVVPAKIVIGQCTHPRTTVPTTTGSISCLDCGVMLFTASPTPTRNESGLREALELIAGLNAPGSQDVAVQMRRIARAALSDRVKVGA